MAIKLVLASNPNQEYKSALVTGSMELAYWPDEISEEDAVRNAESGTLVDMFLEAVENIKDESSLDSQIAAESKALRQELLDTGFLT